MRQGNGGTSTLTDEQILEMEPESEAGGGRNREQGSAARGETRSAPQAPLTGDLGGPLLDAAGGAEQANASLSANVAADAESQGAAPDNSDATADTSAQGAAGEPAWLAALDAQPAAAAEARRWQAAANDVAALDAAYFSADAGARSGLAARLYESDPAAFREMLAASARTLAARDPQGLAELARQLGMPVAEQAAPSRSLTQAARPTASTSDMDSRRETPDSNANAASQHGASFPAESYRAFETTTNENVSRKMHEAIDRSLTSALPEGVAAGARRRMGEDIFREVHAALSGDRELAKQVGETLRDWRFDVRARQQVVALVSGRARAVLPEVARRVVAEWTSSVLASDRAKTARIDAAASRRDITGGRLPEPVAGSARRSREVDYRRMSDEQILDI